MAINIDRTIENLEKHGFNVTFFFCREDAAEYLDSVIDGKIVGFGDSHTISAMGLNELLSEHNTVLDPAVTKDNDEFIEVGKKALTADVFILSANGISETGELVNIDGTGNRVAGSIFGHEKVYFVAGVNKICATLQDAIDRARNVAGPMDAHALGYPTPCAAEGKKCYDCRSEGRICNVLAVYLNKVTDMDMEVVLINETLGF